MVPVLKGARVVLRPPREQDKQDRLACGRSAEYIRMVGGDHRRVAPLTPEQVDRWYERLLAEPMERVIDLGGRCIGTARLNSLNEHERRARCAIGIFDPSAWGKGYGTEATNLVLQYAFETLRLHRVDLRVLACNHRAIACYEKCGFVREGVEREGALIAGRWESDVIMSILEQEYRQRRQRG
ncbi:RimJ/RimL family protein N-acetyltransferase [Symbiobacterium terraclitae]|uniref:RimJ/RimL family protein N-acetyltransferase n=1 Tax=Symbiobacterium terraclitae TaxID=557451 RepID=A0ABS4JU16_9FIRM|nr:GNAT family protein [Symbiobacterium terraclitae]MBP2019032.1 RimJ/RimL family protein N-acetyltransferase [Symbiobacterium terraclitae]